MAAKAWCLFITESSFITPASPNSASNLDTAYCVLDLPDDDAVSIQRKPNVEQLTTAKSRGAPDRVVGDSYGISGGAKGILYPTQAPLIAGWGLQLVDQTATPDEPWTTDEPDGDLASATFALAYEDWDFNVTKHRYRGCKAQTFSIESARGTRGGVVQWMADVVGSDQASMSDSEPALVDYPSDSLAPYHHSDSTLTINNTAISNYESISLRATHALEVAFDESTTAAVIRRQSSTVNMTVVGALKGTPDWEALFTGQTLMASTKWVLTHPGNNHRITMDLQGVARVPNWTRNLRLQNNRPNQTIEIVAQFDRSAGEAFSIAFDDPTP